MPNNILGDATLAAWAQGFGSILAILVAIVLAFVQRSASRRERREDREREHRADRSLLAFALDEVTSYTTRVAARLAKLLSDGDASVVFVPKDWEPPSISENAYRDIARCIGTTSNAVPAKALGDILAAMQVNRARLMRIVEKAGDEMVSLEIAERLYDALSLYARAAGAFDYARHRSEGFQEIDRSSIKSAAFQNHVFREEEAFTPFFDLLGRRHPATVTALKKGQD